MAFTSYISVCIRRFHKRQIFENATRKLSAYLVTGRSLTSAKYQTRSVVFEELWSKTAYHGISFRGCTSAQTLHRVDPYALIEDDLKTIHEDIRNKLIQETDIEGLKEISTYYFDGQGKALRPMVAILMARAVNFHMGKNELLKAQREIAMASEMIHSASLVHDDILDKAHLRRGKPSINVLWNPRQVTAAGKYIIAVAITMVSRLKNDDVTVALANVIFDLVRGEYMQLGSRERENERFDHYLLKTFKKTASLTANSLKAVAILSEATPEITKMAYQYGRNIGLAFQLVDDLLDFVSSTDTMGKPAAADLKLGLATAPVLFACEQYPELVPMIMRRFKESGDVERTFELVHKSRGLEQTKFLAEKHCAEATKLIGQLADSPYQKGLGVVCDLVLNRMK